MVEYVAQIVVFVALFSVLAGSLNLVMGYGGVLSIMHGAFFGIGAYAAAQAVVLFGVPFPLDLLAGFALAGLVAALIGGPVLRLSEWYVIISTLALQLVLSNIFLNWQAVTGGSYGIYGIPRPALAGIEFISLPSFALLAAAIAAVCFLFLWLVVRSPYGLALKGLRDDELLAQSFGKDVLRQRLVSLALGSGLAGVAGGVYARFVGYIEPSSFSISQSLSIITILVVGGLGNLWGTLGGAVLLVTVPQVLRFTPVTSQAVAYIQLLLFGALLILVLRLRPQGLISERAAVRAGPTEPGARGDGRGFLSVNQPPPVQGETGRADPAPEQRVALEIQRVYKSFGGLMAVNNLSLTIRSGQVTAIIGPNGAGKTTLFNMITGYLQPDRGRISYDGHDLSRMKPFEIARLGISRSFQDVRVFSNMTVLENLVLALQGNDIERLSGLFSPRRTHREQDEAGRKAMKHLEAFGLAPYANQRAGDLSYAQQKMLVVVTLVARGDPFLLLDELAAGLDHESIGSLSQTVRQLVSEGRTICLIEHNLEFVWQTADTVMVLDQGELIAQGAPQEIQRDRRAAEVYFGGLIGN